MAKFEFNTEYRWEIYFEICELPVDKLLIASLVN